MMIVERKTDKPNYVSRKHLPNGTAKNRWIFLLLIFLIPACTSLGIPDMPVEVKEVGGDLAVNTTNTVNSGLPWWQWLIIGTFIPSIFEMVSMLRRAITGGL